jgi:hypothetical protein
MHRDLRIRQEQSTNYFATSAPPLTALNENFPQLMCSSNKTIRSIADVGDVKIEGRRFEAVFVLTNEGSPFSERLGLSFHAQ